MQVIEFRGRQRTGPIELGCAMNARCKGRALGYPPALADAQVGVLRVRPSCMHQQPLGRWREPAARSACSTATEPSRLVEKSDLPRIRLHDLRHTHATHLLAANVNVRVVSERLGHASTAFTLDVYGRVLPGQQADAAAAVAALVDK